MISWWLKYMFLLIEFSTENLIILAWIHCVSHVWGFVGNELGKSCVVISSNNNSLQFSLLMTSRILLGWCWPFVKLWKLIYVVLPPGSTWINCFVSFHGSQVYCIFAQMKKAGAWQLWQISSCRNSKISLNKHMCYLE